MSWNFRVYRLPDNGGINGGVYLAIHEAYYGDNGSEEPTRHTRRPSHVDGSDIEELRWRLEQMLKALDKPILDHKQEEPPDEEHRPGPSPCD